MGLPRRIPRLGRLLARAAAPPTRRLGRRGERAAARHLRRRGFRILERNRTTRLGEIDIRALAPDRHTLVVVEVKTRVLGPGGSEASRRPERSVTAHKRRKLLSLARSLQRSPRYRDLPVRIDVVAVEYPPDGGRPMLRHHEAAVRG